MILVDTTSLNLSHESPCVNINFFSQRIAQHYIIHFVELLKFDPLRNKQVSMR